MPSYTENLLRSYYDQLMESQYWSADRMRQYQHEQLTHLLLHARANSPFYARRLDPVFRRDGSIDFDRWNEIPIVKRSDLVDHRESMLTDNVPPHHGQARDYQTSGSTGVPITVRANGIAAIAGRAAEYRAFNWHNLDFSQILCRIVRDNNRARWPDGQNCGPWGPAWAYGTSAGRTLDISEYDGFERMAEFIQRSEATYLIIGSTTAHALALEAKRLGIEIKLDKLFTTGSTPTEPEREAVMRIFGAGLLQRYASKEANAMGHTCPTGRHFHIHSENALVEVLRADGTPCGPGESGTVVVTPFLSTHQPMIRYEQGDIATVGGPCSCGRTLPVLQSIEGRLSHVFHFPDGTSTYRRLPESLRDDLGARVWQVAQVAPDHIELRYEPSNPATTGDEAGAIAFMRSIYPAVVEVTVRRVDKIPLTASGKLIEYVYEVDA